MRRKSRHKQNLIAVTAAIDSQVVTLYIGNSDYCELWGILY